MAKAESLTDYNDGAMKRKNPPTSGDNSNVGNRGKFVKMGKTSSGRANWRLIARDFTTSKGSSASYTKPRPPITCFLYSGSHRVIECPHRCAFSALRARTLEPTTSQQVSEEVEEEPIRIGFIRFLSALRSQLNEMKNEPTRGLMYMDVVINGRATKAMVDMGATDTFITPV